MTAPAPQPQQHCEHECVCSRYQYKSTAAFHDGTRCLANHEGCNPCERDTRSRHHPNTPSKQMELIGEYNRGYQHGFEFAEEALKKNNATIRNATLDVIQEHNDGRLEGLESLMTTPSKERCESAQDMYLKEARFELILIKDLIESLRGEP